MLFNNCIGSINDDEIKINNHIFKKSNIKSVSYFYISSGRTEFYFIIASFVCILTSFFLLNYFLFFTGLLGLILSKVDFYNDYFLVIKTDSKIEPVIEEIRTSKKCDIDLFIENFNSNESSKNLSFTN